jgi:Uma2 family endonuclease
VRISGGAGGVVEQGGGMLIGCGKPTANREGKSPMVQSATLPPLVRGEWFPMTWEEFLDWCDEGQSEWVNGEGIAYVSNDPRHIECTEFLADLFRRYALLFTLGRVYTNQLLMRLPNRPSGRMPDIAFVRREHLDRVGDRWLEGPCDLAVEYLSDDSVVRDTGEKFAEFEAAGLPEYLPIDIRARRHRFLFYRLDPEGRYQEVLPDERGRYHSVVLPGLWIDPEWFWQDPLPDVDDLLLEIAPDAYEAWIMAKLRARGRGAGSG